MERGATTAGSRTKVLYVMGAGHSGSTILGVALGNCADFFYAGEVEEWLVKSGTPPWADGERAAFWKSVAEKTDGEELFGSDAVRSIERSSALLRIDRWPTRRRLCGRYRRLTEELLHAISSTADARHVVDTSHFPLRARELKMLGGIDVYLVFLVRDPHAVVDSNLRQFQRHELAERRLRTIGLNVNLWFTMLVSSVVFLKQRRDRRMFLRHETFMQDPEGVLRQILDLVGSEAATPNLQELRVGTPLEGNRLIRRGVISLERQPQRAERSSLLTSVMQLPWSAVLGRLRPAATGRPAPERVR
ncbi:MAG: Sulfotransferase family [Solirubrobacterales bacterium]|nr:Sulfotransferase family [Solirubrobacterales bacterium]